MKHLDTTQIQQCIDCTLQPADAAAVETHVAECPECRKEVAFQRAICCAVETSSLVEPPFNMTARVLAEVAPLPRVQPVRGLFRNVPALMMAMGIAAVVIVAVSMQPARHAPAPKSSITRDVLAVSQHGVLGYVDSALVLLQEFVRVFTGPYGLAILSIASAAAALALIDRALSHRLHRAL